MVENVKFNNKKLQEQERKKGKIIFASNPIQLQLEVTNRCNLRCPICARSYYDYSMNQIIIWCMERKAVITIITNGILMTEQIPNFLVERQVHKLILQ